MKKKVVDTAKKSEEEKWSFVIEGESLKAFKKLMEMSGFKDPETFIKITFQCYQWIVDNILEGREIIAVDPKGKFKQRLAGAVSKKAKTQKH